MACKACRSRKIKCDRTRPVCKNCSHRSLHCTYAGERRARRWTAVDAADGAGSGSTAIGNPPFQMVNATNNNSNNRAAAMAEGLSADAQPDGHNFAEAPSRHASFSFGSFPIQRLPSTNGSIEALVNMQSFDNDGDDVFEEHMSPGTHQDESLLDRVLEGKDTECVKDRHPAVWIRVDGGDEYTGPSSGISTISDFGLEWIRKNVPDSDVLCQTIRDIQQGVFNHLRQPKCIPKGLPLAVPSSRGPADLSPTQLMRYVDAYFSDVQVVFPILDRQTFLTQLDAMGSDPGPGRSDSWQALLNAVLASGCRATLSEESLEAFKISGCEAWSYFQVALSYEPRIVHGSTDLLAVQAMAVMTVFAQGLSSPQRLEYTLSSVAARLAQSLGLHRHPPPEWKLNQDEVRERNRVFWAIYALDKSIALRCGRPAVIQDDEVSCCFPRGVFMPRPEEAQVVPAVDFFLWFTKLARTCGKVSRLLYSASALYSPTSSIIPVLNRLMRDLGSWLSAIPCELRPGKALGRSMGSCYGISKEQLIVLHSSYYYVLCSIYRRCSPIYTLDGTSWEHLIDSKPHISHIEAARSLVLLTKHLDIESFSPAWLIFYYPFTALTTIFLHVVSNPPDHLSQSNIALMETVVGFFGRLEYVTSGEAAFTKTTEFVRQARSVVDNFRRNKIGHPKTPSPTNFDNLVAEMDLSLQGFTDTSRSRTGMAELFSGTAHQDQVTSTTSLTGPENIFGIASPQSEGSARGQHPSQGIGSKTVATASHGNVLYAGITELLEQFPGDDTQAPWMSDTF